MAVDTQYKRLSITHMLVPSMPAGGQPTGLINQADRQDMMWMYRGLSAGGTTFQRIRARVVGDRYRAYAGDNGA